MATERYFVGPNLLGDIRETIARVQGTPDVESGGHLPFRLTQMMQPSEGGFHIATFTGSWSVSSGKTVTLYNATSTAETLAVTNLLIPVPELSDNTNTPTVCAIGEDRGTWYLLNVRHTNADVLTDVSLRPTQLEFERKRLVSINATISTAAIAISECTDNVATVEQLSFFLR
jgi:hypothetical protein